MADTRLTRQDIVERLDTLSMVIEHVAAECIDDEDLGLAADLWLASSRVLAAADELWRPADDLDPSRHPGNLDTGR